MKKDKKKKTSQNKISAKSQLKIDFLSTQDSNANNDSGSDTKEEKSNVILIDFRSSIYKSILNRRID